MNDNMITCPECGKEINVNEILYHQLEDLTKKNYDKTNEKKEKEIQKQLAEVEAEKEQIKKERVKINDLVAKEVQTKLKLERTIMRKQLQDETSDQISDLQKELQEKSTQVKELYKTKAEVEKLKREKEEMKEQVILEKEKEHSEKIKTENQKIRKQVEDENEMKIKELEKQPDVSNLVPLDNGYESIKIYAPIWNNEELEIKVNGRIVAKYNLTADVYLDGFLKSSAINVVSFKFNAEAIKSKVELSGKFPGNNEWNTVFIFNPQTGKTEGQFDVPFTGKKR